MQHVEKRISKYEDMGLGLFIHWGLYSQLGVGEWTEFIHNRDRSEYETLSKTFTASQFNPRQIVQEAKRMGAKYIVLTTKHHEGFFLYDTKGLSTFDAPHSAAKRDLIKEFVDACNEGGIKPFFYMATYDWHSPLYKNDFESYLEYLRQSVEILCTNYGKIGGLWFDGNWNKKEADWHLDELYGTIREHQPDAIIINNTGLKNMGKVINPEIDAVTYERHTPSSVNHGTNKYVAGEISLTMNQHWGYANNDLSFKSPREIIENIAHSRQIGANILVNIGLTAEGSIPEMSAAYMHLLGQWTNMAAPAIYGVRPSAEVASSPDSRDFVVSDGKHQFMYIFDLKVVGNDNVVLGGEGINLRSFSGISAKIKSVTWLDNNEPVYFMQDKDKGVVTIDATGFTYGTDWVVRVARVDFDD